MALRISRGLDRGPSAHYCTSVLVHNIFELDETSATPIYEQMVEQVALSVAAGRMGPGDDLPSVRTLAAELRVNPNTAARALREMEQAGLAETRRGLGSVVAPGALQAARDMARRALERELGGVVEVGRQLGLDLDDLMGALRRRWENGSHDQA